ncbi:TRAP transporter small permease [Bacillus sp. Marseille-P3661]|uniref:TRAP transporter small permease n=1 Tax=Bacillus sp. Marseille-P3661 TaxID=1936234 RepID=UPI0015E16B78|nr:TRAP transporter small permease [Bacillus sp. Marseille-P3661]
MNKIKKGLELFEDWTAGVLVIAGLGILFYGVVLRYVFEAPTTWQDEVARILLVWGILIGASATLRENNHISMELVYRFFPNSMKKVVDIFGNLVILAFFIFIMVSGFEIVMQKVHTGQESLNGFPLSVIYSILPLMGFLMSIRTIERLFKAFKGEVETGDIHTKL